VHLTLDLGGKRVRPDVEWIESLDYTVDPRRSDKFYVAIRLIAELRDNQLAPGYAGIRPKISAQPTCRNFRIDGPTTHGMHGIVNLSDRIACLTSSLALPTCRPIVADA